MAIAGQSRSELRDLMLDILAAKYIAVGKAIDTSLDSDAYILADVFALLAEQLEYRRLTLSKELFPDTASTAYLEKHAAQVAIVRNPATAGLHRIAVSGTVGSSYTTSHRLVASDGTQYAPLSGGVLASSPQTLEFVAQTPGIVGNKAPGAILSWLSAPTGFTATATVVETYQPGTEVESDADLARRILAWWQERPGSGARADFVAWAEDVDGIDQAYVYPLLDATLGGGVYGATTVVVLGPPGSRVLRDNSNDPLPIVADVKTAIVANLPSCFHEDNLYVVPATELEQSLVVKITPNRGFEFSFTGTATTAAGSTTSVIKLSSRPATLTVGKHFAIPDASVVGGYHVAKVTAVASNDVTIDPPMAVAPAAALTVYPATAHWTAIRDAIVAVFDSLGPGDGATPSRRYPATEDGAPAGTLYRSALEAAVMGVPGLAGAPAGMTGVRSCTVELTGATNPAKVEPAALVLMTPGSIRLTLE